MDPRPVIIHTDTCAEVVKLVVQGGCWLFRVDAGVREGSRSLPDKRVNRLVSFVFITKPSGVDAAF